MRDNMTNPYVNGYDIRKKSTRVIIHLVKLSTPPFLSTYWNFAA